MAAKVMIKLLFKIGYHVDVIKINESQYIALFLWSVLFLLLLWSADLLESFSQVIVSIFIFLNQ